MPDKTSTPWLKTLLPVLPLAASSSPFARRRAILAGNLLYASIGILPGSRGLATVPTAGHSPSRPCTACLCWTTAHAWSPRPT
jgi:hypothetical protein